MVDSSTVSARAFTSLSHSWAQLISSFRHATRRRTGVAAAVGELLAGFSPRNMLAFDVEAAVHYPDIVVVRQRGGRRMNALDVQIASICRARGCTLATRSVVDRADVGVDVVDPWTAPP